MVLTRPARTVPVVPGKPGITAERPHMRSDHPDRPLLRWFDSSHLPAHLQAVVKPFEELAKLLDLRLLSPFSDEPDMALRKLLEAKDCAVRAAIEAHESAASLRAQEIAEQYS